MRIRDFCLASTVIALCLPSSAQSAKDIVINESSVERTYDCEGGRAVVNGSGGTLSFRNCATVVVNGSRSVIDAGAASTLSIVGNDNKVTWEPGPKGREPVISNMGSRNSVSRGSGPGPSAGISTKGGDGVRIETGSGLVQVSGDGSSVVVGEAGVSVNTGKEARSRASSTKKVASSATAEEPSGPREPIVVDGNEITRSYDCAGRDALVNGNRNVLTFTGCGRVTVAGNRNRVTTSHTATLSVPGNDNEVTYSTSEGERKPSVSNLGSRNKISPAR